MPDKTGKPTGEDIYEFRKTDLTLSWSDVGKVYGESAEALRKREQRYRQKNDIRGLGTKEAELDDTPPKKRRHKVRFVDKGFSAEAYSLSDRIRSLDQLIASSGTDLKKWQVTRHVINVWESGRKKKIVDLEWNNGVMDGFVQDTGDWQLTDIFQVKAWFEPRKEEPCEKALEALIDRVKSHAPIYDSSSFAYKPTNDGYLLVPNLYDAHFGKRSHRSFKYTLDEASSDFVRIAKAITSQSSSNRMKPSRILFPIGHDMLHVDNLLETTTRGTWVETSEDIREAIDAACEATVKAIEAFATIAPVDVVPVEGNHDRLQTYWLGKYLQAFFSNHPNVEVYDMKLERQYYQWGRVGIGLTHNGNKPQELATLFPVEARQMWADIEWTEWLTGHFHHNRGALYAVDSVRGTVVRTIPALCSIDNYHSLHMYVGTHMAAEVLYYHKENGPAGSFPVFVSEL